MKREELAEGPEEQTALAALEGARLEPLPEGLHATLMQAARRGRTHERGPARTSWLSFFTTAVRLRPAYALGGAVAAGAAMGALGLALVLGVAGNRPGLDSISASLPPAAPAIVTTLDRGDARVDLTTRRVDGDLIVQVNARGGERATLTLAWDEGTLGLLNVRWEGTRPAEFETGAGSARLPIPLASGSELTFREIASEPRAVRATLDANGEKQEETLRLPR